jgi:hypothetical protein
VQRITILRKEPTAVHCERLAGDTSVADQQHNGLRDLVTGADPANRDSGNETGFNQRLLISVSTRPGATALTVIPSGARRAA